jgi:hypothetical protein
MAKLEIDTKSESYPNRRVKILQKYDLNFDRHISAAIHRGWLFKYAM